MLDNAKAVIDINVHVLPGRFSNYVPERFQRDKIFPLAGGKFRPGFSHGSLSSGSQILIMEQYKAFFFF